MTPASAVITPRPVRKVSPPVPPMAEMGTNCCNVRGAEYPRSRVCGDGQEAQWRLAIIQPIRAATDARTAERASCIAEAAAAVTTDWRGRRRTIGERTIRQWIERYEAGGLASLMRKTPKNAGAKRVHFSRPWDAAAKSAGISATDLAAIVSKVRTRVRGEWAAGTPSWPTVQLNALPLVVKLSREAGLTLPDLEMRKACQVPRRFIEAERRYAIVAVKNKDAGRYAAEMEPRIKRHRLHLRPGDWLAADVHHLDILFRCPDGRIVTPKAVAWVCLATNRAWLDIYIMPKGEMIRSEHVIQSFVNMTSDHNWGVPSRLYLDNGGE